MLLMPRGGDEAVTATGCSPQKRPKRGGSVVRGSTEVIQLIQSVRSTDLGICSQSPQNAPLDHQYLSCFSAERSSKITRTRQRKPPLRGGRLRSRAEHPRKEAERRRRAHARHAARMEERLFARCVRQMDGCNAAGTPVAAAEPLAPSGEEHGGGEHRRSACKARFALRCRRVAHKFLMPKIDFLGMSRGQIGQNFRACGALTRALTRIWRPPPRRAPRHRYLLRGRYPESAARPTPSRHLE